MIIFNPENRQIVGGITQVHNEELERKHLPFLQGYSGTQKSKIFCGYIYKVNVLPGETHVSRNFMKTNHIVTKIIVNEKNFMGDVLMPNMREILKGVK